MVFLKDQAEQFIGKLILKANGNAKEISFDIING